MQEEKHISNGEFYGEAMERQSRKKAVWKPFCVTQQTSTTHGRKIKTSDNQLIITRLPRAENGTRTRDLNLGKVVLYQLSYFRRSGWFPIASAKVVKSRSLQIFRSLFYGFLFGEGSEFRYPAHVRRSPQHVAGAGTRQYPPPPYSSRYRFSKTNGLSLTVSYRVRSFGER